MNDEDIKMMENDLLSEDYDYAKFHQLWEPLSKFITDYEHLKGLNDLTQNEIAVRAKTTQSAISRLIRMKGKPTYTLLNKVSNAVGGKLFVTPLAEMTVTLPYDLHAQAIQLAEAQNMSVTELMVSLLRESFNNQQTIEAIENSSENNAVEKSEDFRSHS